MATTNLLARFQLVDEMSQRLAQIAEAGRDMVEQWERLGETGNAAFDDIADGAIHAAAAADGAADSVDRLQAAADSAATSADSLAGGLNDYENAVAGAADASDEFAQAAADSAEAADELGRRAGEAADEAEESGQRVENAANNLADALTAAGIVMIVQKIAEALMAASDAAAEFETGTAKISTIADTGKASMSDIADGIMDLSMDTGEAAEGLNEAVYSAISASVDTAAAVEFTGTATKLAAGGFTKAATAVDVLTTTLNAYGLEAGEAENIADMLITTQNLGKTTVDELAASVGKVIPIAAAYGVEMDNLSTAYAELTKGGIATAEAGTYLKAMLNELGDSGSAVSAVLREQTGESFARLTAQGYSLGDVLAVLGDSVNGDSGAFNELWSSSEAGVGALALYNAGAAQFNTTLDAMQNSLGATEAAYTAMNDTVADSREDLSTAAQNLQIVIGQNINPLVGTIYEVGTDALNMFTRFANEHPIAVKAATAVAIGLGTVATAITGVGAAALALKTVIPAVAAFGSTVNAALGPVGWIAMAVTGVTVAVGAFIGMLDDAEDETAGMTAVTREQYYELQNLNAEYEAACEKYGETSEEASRLKYQVDDLSAAFAANRQTVEQFVAQTDALCASVTKISDDFDESLSSIGNAEAGSLALIQKYADLTAQIELTEGQQRQLAAVTSALAKSYPDLTAQLDSAMIGTEEYALAVRRLCEQQAEEQRQQQAQDTYIEALQKQAELTDEIARAEENINLERAHLRDMDAWDRAWANKDDLKAYKNALEELNEAAAENDALIAQIEQGWAEIANAEEAAANSVNTWQEAVSVAYGDVQAQVEALCAAYDAAYQAAAESFAGQYSLFDTAGADMSATVANAQAALDSQLAYWETYQANVEILKNTSAADLGITQANYEAVMAYAQDGSEQAAGLAASMAAAISSGNKEAVVQLASTVEQVRTKRQEVAAATADWLTDFSAQMDELKQTMQDTVAEMNLSDEAAASATATIDAYTAQILAGKNNAAAAAKSVAASVSAALADGGGLAIGPSVDSSSFSGDLLNIAQAFTPVNIVSPVPGHANGTTNAESFFIAGEEGPELVAPPGAATSGSDGYFIAGENGPELIVGHQGSTVFTAAETDRLLNALNGRERPLQVLPDLGGSNGRSEQPRHTVDERHIKLEIAGSGSIDLSAGGRETSKEAILEVLWENLKPVLASIIQSEIFEEGDLAYGNY